MASYDITIVTTTRIEYRVPAPHPLGACWVEMQKAIAAATQNLVEHGIIKQGAEPSDTDIRITAGDEEIVVHIEINTTP